MSESDIGKVANFPIRAMDYDKETKMLYTGDEMGYMNKWNISQLVQKMADLTPEYTSTAAEMMAKQKYKATFLTGMNEKSNDPKMIFTKDDVI